MPSGSLIENAPAVEHCLAVGLLAFAVSGCGDDGGPKAPKGVKQSVFERQLKDAQRVSAGDFAPAGEKTLQQLAATAKGGPQAGLATSVFVPGENRLAFGVLDAKRRFVYGKTAVYAGRSPSSRAQGPYAAPADSLVTDGRYRSRQAATEDGPLAAIYAAKVPFKRPGRYAVLVLTKTASGLLGATTNITVRRDTPIPAVGERPPPVSTDTIAGDEKVVDTRVPPAPELHTTNLKDVLGKRPTALLIATPQLCQSRVCGPVVDIELQLKQKYGNRTAFIHQEVYVDNKLEAVSHPVFARVFDRLSAKAEAAGQDGRLLDLVAPRDRFGAKESSRRRRRTVSLAAPTDRAGAERPGDPFAPGAVTRAGPVLATASGKSRSE